jgi:hypothetical protein
VGKGQHPWDLKPDSVMTNTTVGTITQSPQGNVIKVSYKGTESEYAVDPTTPIFADRAGFLHRHGLHDPEERRAMPARAAGVTEAAERLPVAACPGFSRHIPGFVARKGARILRAPVG